eukprot:7037398-Karenia_brevis.AAC.1
MHVADNIEYVRHAEVSAHADAFSETCKAFQVPTVSHFHEHVMQFIPLRAVISPSMTSTKTTFEL